MIVPMMKYSFVLYHSDYESFLKRLQELGLVDITVMGWEPDSTERELLSTIEQYRTAHGVLKTMSEQRKEELDTVQPFVNATETFEAFRRASAEMERLKSLIMQTENDIAMLRPWGEFDPQRIEQLRLQGIEIHFFSCFTKEFAADGAAWGERYAIEPIAQDGAMSYFVVIGTTGDAPIDLPVQELKLPATDAAEREHELVRLNTLLDQQDAIMMRAAKSYMQLKPHEQELRNDLKLSKVTSSGGERQADGALIVLEAWATSATQKKVDAFLDNDDSVIYFKERPTPDDNPPVLLKNNWFARLFEFVGNLYSLPAYHSQDLTPFFAPFFMLFFGFCLGDAGYGLLIVVAAAVLFFKLDKTKRPLAALAFWCGLATVFFGLLTGTLFGIEMAKLPALARFKELFVPQNSMFQLALYVGVIQIIYGMGIKAYGRIKRYGFLYGVSTIGWMIVVIASGLAMGFPKPIPGFDMHSTLYVVLAVIGFAAMLFMNNPKKNIFMNFGLGLWDLYGSLTGFLGDLLSYIRLFALGLCSGVLATVFNSLAFGLSPDIPVIGILVTIIIMLIGHGINIFMSILGSFVHPMRLTFVEFYKNAGFEDGGRAFEPLRKEK